MNHDKVTGCPCSMLNVWIITYATAEFPLKWQASHSINFFQDVKTLKIQEIFRLVDPLWPLSTTKVYKNEVLKTYNIEI